MVAQRKAQQQDTEEMYEGVVRAIRVLPRTVIPRLLHEIADQMDHQGVEENPHTEASRLLQEMKQEVSIYQTLKEQGGPFAEMIALLEKGQLSDEEAQHLRELGHQQAVGLLADWRPAPTDEEVERILSERVMERYGR
jgi:hypothetical protein